MYDWFPLETIDPAINTGRYVHEGGDGCIAGNTMSYILTYTYNGEREHMQSFSPVQLCSLITHIIYLGEPVVSKPYQPRSFAFRSGFEP